MYARRLLYTLYSDGDCRWRLDAEQQAAVNSCVDTSKRLVSVTGEAGTGKTTIIKQACDILKDNNVSFAIAAPTGKAARRIREATGYPATTIHKLLEFNSLT